MRRYLLSTYQPDGTPDPEMLAEVMKKLDALNQDLRAAGAWVFSGPQHPPASATVVKGLAVEVRPFQ